MEPATAALIARAAIAAGTNKKVWTGIASVLAALCLPVILAVMCYISIASGGTEHNRAAVHLAFDGGEAPDGMPADYQAYVRQMQESFAELDAILDDIDGMTEGEVCDRYLVKSVFYSLYFGADRVRLETDDYKKFADCFVDYEERTQNIEQEDGTVTLEKYTVAVAIGDKTKIFQKLASDYGVTATYEQQSNAVNVWYVAKYDTAAPTEGDEFSDWGGWNGAGAIPVYDLPANGNGSDIVQLALSRLGHPYSQALRGTGNYVDCSYLTLWCYRQIGISLPGTAAEQGGKTVEELLKSHLDKSYEKNVPAQVRKFVESRMETPQETANQEEESQRTGGTRQQRASGRRSRETQNQEEQPREPVPETVEETAENTMSMGM